MKPWKKISSHPVLDTRWVKVYKNSYALPNGTRIPEYYVEERADSAVCVCRAAGKYLVMRQFRPGINDFTYCHPGGRLETSDYTPLSGAMRELLEETGLRPTRVAALGAFAQIPAILTSRVHFFLAECSRAGDEVKQLDGTEDADCVLVTKNQLLQIIDSGRMDCMGCVAATYRAIRVPT